MISPIALRLLTLLALSASALCACAPAPVPSPTPSPVFESEEEAFAAAEATYRAYVQASNGTMLHDPDTFEALFSWLIGEALTSAKENFSRFHAEGWTRTGTTTFDNFTPISYDGESLISHLCLDVSAVTLRDADGNVVGSDRPDRQPIQIQMAPSAATSTGLAIASTTAAGDLTCG
ncbi:MULTISPECIES: hypothetical protein [Microbacterium]|uniref:hypothetical protein n=1 Tax=Microbacterium TaxID=33882 RepID=UPI0011EB24EA|nr:MULTISPECIES: hypothetical protein [Microbacterium]